MLKSYTFILTPHQRLHEFVMAFFSRIEHETGEFSLDFFEAEFRPVVRSHWKILKMAFAELYNEIRQWPQADRSRFCDEVRQSNNIEQICAGQIIPRRIPETETGAYEKVRTLFLHLYSNVLDGDPLHEALGVTLRQHFDEFRQANKAITLCPMCGISELKTEHDVSRDQYDHYLPKAFYPLSAVNFYNLVPICKECNSFDVKGEKDVVALANGRLFYPYAQNHKGVEIRFSIQQDSAIIDDIVWQVELESRDGKDQEVNTWKQIYKIEERYVGFIKGRIPKWYKAYWEFLNNADLPEMTEGQKRQTYFAVLKADEAECLNIIRGPALLTFLGNELEMARQEAQRYS